MDNNAVDENDLRDVYNPFSQLDGFKFVRQFQCHRDDVADLLNAEYHKHMNDTKADRIVQWQVVPSDAEIGEFLVIIQYAAGYRVIGDSHDS